MGGALSPEMETRPTTEDRPPESPHLEVFPPENSLQTKALQKARCPGEGAPPTRAAGVPGDGADGEVRRGLRLVHEQLQVDTALVPRHGHDGVGLSLVTCIKQLRDEPAVQGRLISARRRRLPCRSPPCSVLAVGPPFQVGAPQAREGWGLRPQGRSPARK